jgi:DNA-binding response OmpR family regulator
MKLRILVFDQEHSLRELLKTFLKQYGHEVSVYSDPTVCPLYQKLTDESCCCPRERACADAMLVDINTPRINAFEFFKLQRSRGCKALDANKAVMSAYLTSALDQAMTEFGCHHIGKPFRLREIREWIDECAARLAATPPASL